MEEVWRVPGVSVVAGGDSPAEKEEQIRARAEIWRVLELGWQEHKDIDWLLARVTKLEAELESAIISDIAARNPGIDVAELRAYRREKGLARG